MTEVREALIESVSKLIWERQHCAYGAAWPYPAADWVWLEVADDEREEYRRIADAVIALLLPGLGEEVIG